MNKETAHYNLPNGGIDIYPASSRNEITKEYYNFLVGEINRGVIHRAIAKIPMINGDWRYFLISHF